MRAEPVDLFLEIIGWGGGTESDSGHILLIVRLKFLCQLGGLADTYQKHAGSQRVQRAGMSDLEVLLAEMTDGSVLDLPDHVCRSPSVWFVDGDNNPLRIVLYVS